MKQDPAPIYVETFDLAGWLLARLQDHDDALARRLVATVLALLEDITLALKDRDRSARLDAADDGLIRLRLLVRLSEATGLLDASQRMFALEGLDRIGRQLGGWQKAQDRSS